MEFGSTIFFGESAFRKDELLMVNAISLFEEAFELIPSEKSLSGLVRIAVGTMQVAVGVLILPLQVIGKICKNNQPYIFSQGISNCAKISKVILGIIQVAVGTLVFPFQLCGRVFKHKQPFLIVLGVSNIQKGLKQSGSFLGKVLLLI